jgi:L-ascorbate metabolism protein UlaG (beta-lactamase superfamily)
MQTLPTKSATATLIPIILFAMAFNVYSQNFPASDVIKTEAGNAEITFIGHASLLFRIGDMNVYFDPVSGSGNFASLPKADLILVTHDHYDHLDNDLINSLKKEGTVIICNSTAGTKVKGSVVMKAGESRLVNKLSIEAVEAYNIVNMRSQGQPYHPKGVGSGYILNYGGKRFYIAGDTENTPEMKALKNIDVAFLPMNLPYTMTPEMVADAARAFKPGILYPYHTGDTNTGKIIELMKGSGVEVRIRDLK